MFRLRVSYPKGRVKWGGSAGSAGLGRTREGGSIVSDFVIACDRYDRRAARSISTWARDYLRRVAVADLACATGSVFLAVQLRFGNHVTRTYFVLSLVLPVLWLVAVGIAGGYDVRFIGTGSDEFRKVLNAGVSLTAAVALFSYATDLKLSRGYLRVALPCITLFDLVVRYVIRKRLHKLRAYGHCMQSVVAVGHEQAVADLVERTPA